MIGFLIQTKNRRDMITLMATLKAKKCQEEALAHHGSTDYFKAAMKESAAFLAEKPEMEFYNEVIRINRQS